MKLKLPHFNIYFSAVQIPNRIQWCILVVGCTDVTGVSAGRVREERISALPRRENFLKEGLKQGILVHSEQIVKGLG